MDQYKQLLEDSKSYLKTRYDLLRLELLDKLSQIFGILVFAIVAMFLFMGAVAYFSVALVNTLGNVIPVWAACLILGVLLLIVLYVLNRNKEKLFINPFVKILSGLLFEQPRDEEQQSETNNQNEPQHETNV